MQIGLVYDLRHQYLAEGFSEEDVAEFDSEETIAKLAAAIRACGHEVVCIGRGQDLARRLVDGERWDLVFSIAEGLAGRSREAQVPALCEMYGVPYTFSDPLVCAATLDKAFAKRIVMSYGVSTPKFAVIREAADLATVALRYPLFVKPLAEGTGKGIDAQSRINTPEELRIASLAIIERLRQPALVEEYLPGREFTTGILGTGRNARAIGTMEVCMLANASSVDYTFDVKEQCESCVSYEALEAGALRESIEALALDAYRGLECRDTARVDIRLDRDGRPAFMEVNPLPGLHPTHSDLPMIATRAGIAYEELIGAIIESARARISRAAASPSLELTA